MRFFDDFDLLILLLSFFQIVMIGDDIIGDVKGAMDAGMRGVLVRTGKFRAAVDENHVSVKPSGIVDDLRAAVDMILS